MGFDEGYAKSSERKIKSNFSWSDIIRCPRLVGAKRMTDIL
jgi:hypothetical protein